MRSSVRPLFLSSLPLAGHCARGGSGGARHHDAGRCFDASSVDTSALLSGNLAFKRDSVNHSAVGLNAAFKVMMSADFNNAELAECIPHRSGLS
jgi:hypothetical protein